MSELTERIEKAYSRRVFEGVPAMGAVAVPAMDYDALWLLLFDCKAALSQHEKDAALAQSTIQTQHRLMITAEQRGEEKAIEELSQQEAESVEDSVLKLSELMRGLEIPPASAANKPEFFYFVGRAIADQAKQAPGAPTAPQPVESSPLCRSESAKSEGQSGLPSIDDSQTSQGVEEWIFLSRRGVYDKDARYLGFFIHEYDLRTYMAGKKGI